MCVSFLTRVYGTFLASDLAARLSRTLSNVQSPRPVQPLSKHRRNSRRQCRAGAGRGDELVDVHDHLPPTEYRDVSFLRHTLLHVSCFLFSHLEIWSRIYLFFPPPSGKSETSERVGALQGRATKHPTAPRSLPQFDMEEKKTPTTTSDSSSSPDSTKPRSLFATRDARLAKKRKR